LGHQKFETNNSYIVTGWSADQNEVLPAGDFVVLLPTMNLDFNHDRTQSWFAGNVTLTVDHTFKVICSLVPGIQGLKSPGSLGQTWDQTKSLKFMIF
jgi:hypothetical protein